MNINVTELLPINDLKMTLAVDPVWVDGLLWGVLWAGVFFATVHLVSMLLTRWGDTNASKKSLIFSVLLHISCTFGMVAATPEWKEVAETASTEPPPERIQLQDVFVEGEERVERKHKGNTPVWEQLIDPVQQQLTRLDRNSATWEELQAPLRPPSDLTPPEVDIPELPADPEQKVAVPELHRSGDPGLQVESAPPLKVEDPLAEARRDVESPSTSRLRKRIARSSQQESPLQRTPTQGAIERIRKEFSADDQVAAIDAPEELTAHLKQGPDAGVIRHRTGPAPSPLRSPDAGTTTSEAGPGSENVAPGPPKFTRLKSRTIQSREDGTTDRYRPERTPQTPLPQPSPQKAVRTGFPQDIIRPGLGPNVVRPNFAAKPARRVNLPTTYRLRSLARRHETALKYGGTDDSERAVEASLRWLAIHQYPNGYWDANQHGAGQIKIDENGLDRKNAGINADSGITALAVLAFLGAGYTHEEGQYADHIDRALRWLVRQQQPNGYLGGRATYYAQMYCHGMATYALAEAYGMQSDPTTDTRLRRPLIRAVEFILSMQNPNDGGWRYRKGIRSDMSMFGWQLMALKSAEIAGIQIPPQNRHKMIQFLKNRSLGPNSGLAAYRLVDPPLPPTPTMTAEALFCKQMLGIERENPASIEAVEYLLQNLPRRSQYNEYYWYYGTMSLFQYGGEAWRQWNESLRDLLVSEQRTDGEANGSWDPRPPWGPYGGRVYSTALCTLCLEVYHRYLPLYNMGGRYDAED